MFLYQLRNGWNFNYPFFHLAILIDIRQIEFLIEVFMSREESEVGPANSSVKSQGSHLFLCGFENNERLIAVSSVFIFLDADFQNPDRQ